MIPSMNLGGGLSALPQDVGGGPGIGPHRYWRFTAIQTSASFLEISELRLFEDEVDVTSGATISASHAVAGGSLANLVDGNLSTRAYWSEATVEGGGFWIRFDFGAGNDKDINGVKQGGFDTTGRHMIDFTLESSDDGSTWAAAGSKSGLAYPGNNTLSDLYTIP